jgi:heme exporter protein A
MVMPYNGFSPHSPVQQTTAHLAASRAELMRLCGEELTLERGGRVIFRRLTFIAQAGELILLQGRNGSGKTSLLRLIAGLLRPIEGRLTLAGGADDLTIGQQAHLIGHGLALRTGLTVAENLAFWTSFLGGGKMKVGLEAFGLVPLAEFPAGILSDGQQRRLNLARLAAVQRKIWLLDEPSVGLDRASAKQLTVQMCNHLEGGGIIIAASHGEFEIPCANRIELGGAS